jgi:flagellar hook-associated protein 3 FlgL
MRIADKMSYAQVESNISKNRTEMADLQNQAATQKRVTKPSDDPLAAARVLGVRVDLSGNKQFVKNLQYAKSFVDFTDQSLADLTESLMRAKDLALSQANDASSSDESRKAVATEMEQLHNQMVQIGNRKLGDRFIFGGYKTQKAPFDPDGKYSGDHGEMMIHVDKENFLALNIPGGRVFLGQGVSRDGFSEPTPKQATSIEELQTQLDEQAHPEVKDQKMNELRQELNLRGPASLDEDVAKSKDNGTNIFNVVRDLEISLRTNDKEGIQDSLDNLDDALSQVILTRSQVGSRSTVIESNLQSLEKMKVDNQMNISQLEDADIFSTVSDINKTESTLQASLQTSSKLVQKSLLDFLR